MISNYSSSIAILPFIERTYDWICKNGKPFTLAPADMKIIEKVIRQCLEDNNVMDINLGYYKRQYISAISELGDKIVWVNCFPGSQIPDWTKQIIKIEETDGPAFSLKININRKQYSDFTLV